MVLWLKLVTRSCDVGVKNDMIIIKFYHIILKKVNPVCTYTTSVARLQGHSFSMANGWIGSPPVRRVYGFDSAVAAIVEYD